MMSYFGKVILQLYAYLIGFVYIVKEQLLDQHQTPDVGRIDHSGVNIVITGASRGIGMEAAKKLLKLKCRIIVGCRGVDKAAENLNAKEYGDRLIILPLDLMKLSSVRMFAEEVKKTGMQVHCLINNAGMLGSSCQTEDGFEVHVATNYLGHFLLTHLLFPSLESASTVERPARIVNVSSCVHYLGSWMDMQDINAVGGCFPEQLYANSKAAQVMFSQYLDSMQASKVPRVRCIALHPGVVFTDIFAGVWWVKAWSVLVRCMMKTAEQGGDTLVHAALAPDLATADTKAKYLENSKLTRISHFTASLDNQRILWENTTSMLDIKEFGISS